MHEQVSLGVQHHQEVAPTRCVSGGGARERLPRDGNELMVQLDLPALRSELGEGISDLGDNSVLEGFGVGSRCRQLGSNDGEAKFEFAAGPNRHVPLPPAQAGNRDASQLDTAHLAAEHMENRVSTRATALPLYF